MRALPLRDLQAPPPVSLDVNHLDRIVKEFQGDEQSLIPLLQRTQDAYGYLPREALRHISERTTIPLNRLFGVATFYRQFRLSPPGRHIVRICDGTSCHVCGSERNLDAVRQELSIEPGRTTDDGKVTLEVVYCLGACARSPVALIDGHVHARVCPSELIQRLRMLD